MQRSYIKELKDKVGKKVKISGWVDVRRDHGKLIFVDLRDASGKIQIVAGPEADKLRSEWVISIEGEVKKRPDNLINAKEDLGEIEISAD